MRKGEYLGNFDLMALLVVLRFGDSTPERGGRAKRYFRITGTGIREVRDTRRSLMNLWKGLPELKGDKA